MVRDYDEALEFYIHKLGFELVEDTPLSPEKRWVVIKPRNSSGAGCHLLLARAANPRQEQAVGNQSGGRVWLFMYTDNLDRDYKLLMENNIEIVRPPSEEEYGKVLVFADLYGNRWDLIKRK